jgi:hypothetical protein
MRMGSHAHQENLSPRSIPTPSFRAVAPKERLEQLPLPSLTAAYHMLKDGTLYQDLGSNHSTTAQKASKFYNSSTVCKTSDSPSGSLP